MRVQLFDLYNLADDRPGRADRLRRELERVCDLRLRAMLYVLADESARRAWLKWTITCLARTALEQEKQYPPGDKRGGHSPHVPDARGLVRACDLRVAADRSRAQAEETVNFLNGAFGDVPQPSAIYHDVGSGWHIHIQVPRYEVIAGARLIALAHAALGRRET